MSHRRRLQSYRFCWSRSLFIW